MSDFEEKTGSENQFSKRNEWSEESNISIIQRNNVLARKYRINSSDNQKSKVLIDQEYKNQIKVDGSNEKLQYKYKEEKTLQKEEQPQSVVIPQKSGK